MYKTPATTDTVKSYSVHIDDATLIIPFAKIHPGMLMAQAETMKREPALYPFTCSEVKAYNIATGSFSWTMDNPFQDSIPKRFVVGLVDSSAYSGDNQKSPFNFEGFDVNFLEFQVDGLGQTLQPDYINENYVTSYARLFEWMPPEQKEPPNISYYDYGNGYAQYVFDLEKTKNPSVSNPLRRGQRRLTVKFSKATA